MRPAFSFPAFGRYASVRMFAVSLCLGVMSIGVSAWLCATAADSCDRRVGFEFTAIPAGSGSLSLVQICARGPGASTAPQGCDDFVVWDLPGSDRYFQYLVGPAQTCPKNFDGKVREAEGRHLEFTGSYLRDFGTGTGPFATGVYERFENGASIEAGTFEFFE